MPKINTLKNNVSNAAIEADFPCIQISKLSEKESWRKEINRPIYHIHKWWATRLGSIFRAINIGALSPLGYDIWENYYNKHDFSNKIIFDPFMGSGTTLGEAIKLGARTIGCDINPVSTFIVKQSFTDIPESELIDCFTSIKNSVEKIINYYYKTLDQDNRTIIPVLYYFWVKTVTLPDDNVVPLFSSYVFSRNAYPKKQPQAQILCPKCWNIFESRYDSIDVKCPHCNYKFNPQKGTVSRQHVIDSFGNQYKIKDLISNTNTPPKHKLYAKLALQNGINKVYLPITDYDINLYDEASSELAKCNLPIPYSEVRPGINTNQARNYNYLLWKDFFNDRQLLCLGILLQEILTIKDITLQEQFLCLFSGTLEFNNMFCSYKGEGTGAVRHMFSNHILKPEKTPLENSIWGNPKSSGTFSTLFESRLLPAKRYLTKPFDLKFVQTLFNTSTDTDKIVTSNALKPSIATTWADFSNKNMQMLILNGNSSLLDLPDKSVDAIVTDPPYFDFVNYSELSDFFYSWLILATKNRYDWMSKNNCFNDGEVQNNDPLVFANQLKNVFLKCHNLLKDDGTLTFSFHHSRPEGWAAIYSSIVNANFILVSTYPVHAELKVASPKSASNDPISLDALLICKKNDIFNIASYIDIYEFLEHYINLFNDANIILSKADQFVILASRFITNSSINHLPYDFIVRELKSIYDKLQFNYPKNS